MRMSKIQNGTGYNERSPMVLLVEIILHINNNVNGQTVMTFWLEKYFSINRIDDGDTKLKILCFHLTI